MDCTMVAAAPVLPVGYAERLSVAVREKELRAAIRRSELKLIKGGNKDEPKPSLKGDFRL